MVRMTLLVCYLAFSLVRLVSGTGKGTGAPEEVCVCVWGVSASGWTAEIAKSVREVGEGLG